MGAGGEIALFLAANCAAVVLTDGTLAAQLLDSPSFSQRQAELMLQIPPF